MLPNSEHPILYFDGVCNLCNGAVQFFIKRDRNKRFRFASLQSTSGEQVIDHIREREGKIPDSILLVYQAHYYTKSDAIIRSLKMLGGLWRLTIVLKVFPKFIRDAVYDLIAKNRYKWFGKKDECMIPTPDLSHRFLS